MRGKEGVLRFRVSVDDKQKFVELCKKAHMTPSEAIRLYVRDVIHGHRKL